MNLGVKAWAMYDFVYCLTDNDDAAAVLLSLRCEEGQRGRVRRLSHSRRSSMRLAVQPPASVTH